jgi:hypothetical protein
VPSQLDGISPLRQEFRCDPKSKIWPAAGSVDTEIRCLMELEGSDAEKDVQPRVQA